MQATLRERLSWYPFLFQNQEWRVCFKSTQAIVEERDVCVCVCEREDGQETHQPQKELDGTYRISIPLHKQKDLFQEDAAPLGDCVCVSLRCVLLLSSSSREKKRRQGWRQKQEGASRHEQKAESGAVHERNLKSAPDGRGNELCLVIAKKFLVFRVV